MGRETPQTCHRPNNEAAGTDFLPSHPQMFIGIHTSRPKMNHAAAAEEVLYVVTPVNPFLNATVPLSF
ncbi:hypothetical protein K443DRAFT_683011 [Laccaria amethystina LaAM-08-1]|jgi:hypothetical protein|uniref:Unplaced genomic scaffold K443scaffold_219, whole genome shotgun sequence n=1 Tax=Laccaria amethystina LaAM-08-1 TaxID=1095629 RepID=A0A0C9X2U0_9AGAR|nr:hypothetical protein K443DRAFT_683011 [Laccaria amethystina LaAM-08-1]